MEDADEDDLYAAMDWLLARQERIEVKLARRHLMDGGPVFYDVTSSDDAGRTCPLMRFGYNGDGKRGKTQVIYGVLTGAAGCPVAVSVYPGNTGDPATLCDQVENLKGRFGLERVVLVGDRGMVTEARIETLRRHPRLGWISALRSSAVRGLVEDGALQPSLFDERTLAAITTPAFPGERLVACYNPLLANERARKREDLLEIADSAFASARDTDAIAAEAWLDGISVIRTSEPAERLSAADAVRGYKGLAQVEQAFRCLKGLDILIRPIRHHEERRVRAHIFLCLLASHLEWHLRKALAPLLFDDETLDQDRKSRDPVAPAAPSPAARRKKIRRRTDDGLPVHSFETLIAELGTRCRHQCRLMADGDAPAVQRLTEPTPIQQRVLDLIDAFPVPGTD